jgi:putative glutamine transport system permease protein
MGDYPFRPVVENWPMFVQGLGVTLQVGLLSLVLSLALGLLLALLRLSAWGPAQGVALVYVEALRNVPPLVLLFFIFFALPRAGIVLSPFVSGVLGLSIYHATFMGEILRAGLEAVGRPQMEAARSLGLSFGQSMRDVMLPQAGVVILPPMASMIISLVKTTSIVAVISVEDIMYHAEILEAQTFRPFEVFGAAGALYLVISLVLGRAFRQLEGRLMRHRAPALA